LFRLGEQIIKEAGKDAGRLDTLFDRYIKQNLRAYQQQQKVFKSMRAYDAFMRKASVTGSAQIQRLAKQAKEYASKEFQEYQAARAAADVTRASDIAQKNVEQRMASYGVDPSQVRTQAIDAGIGQQAAAAAAAAGDVAREHARAEAMAREQLLGQTAQGYMDIWKEPMAISAQAPGISADIAGGVFPAAASVTASQLAPYEAAISAGRAGGEVATAGAGALQDLYRLDKETEGGGFFNQLLDVAAPIAGRVIGAGLADGGYIPRYADGGALPMPVPAPGMTRPVLPAPMPGVPVSSGSGIDDRNLVRMSGGEYVIPADVVLRKGTEFFDKLREKYHVPALAQRLQPRPAARFIQPVAGIPV
jgi:hypothetical protein